MEYVTRVFSIIRVCMMLDPKSFQNAFIYFAFISQEFNTTHFNSYEFFCQSVKNKEKWPYLLFRPVIHSDRRVRTGDSLYKMRSFSSHVLLNLENKNNYTKLRQDISYPSIIAHSCGKTFKSGSNEKLWLEHCSKTSFLFKIL